MTQTNSTPDSRWLIERERQLQQARRLIKARTSLLISGPPRVGKTTFVTNLTSKLSIPVQWVNLTSSADPFVNVNLTLQLLRQDSPREPLVVVLDGAEVFTSEDLARVIRDFRNYKIVRSVIVTSRNSGLELRGIREINLKYPEGKLYGLRDQLVTPPRNIIQLVAPQIIAANDVLIEKLKRTPQDLFKITPRQFEEVIADLLSNMGMEVELTPATRDGGKDILAYMKTEIGRRLCLVEAKRYDENHPVGVSLVRGLFGTLVDHQATTGMLVTTSRFSTPAQAFQERHEYRLSLKDYGDVVSWILKYKKSN